MATSPSGEFLCITNGDDLTVYLMPQQTGFGDMGRIDLRSGATAETLRAVVMRKTMALAE